MKVRLVTRIPRLLALGCRQKPSIAFHVAGFSTARCFPSTQLTARQLHSCTTLKNIQNQQANGNSAAQAQVSKDVVQLRRFWKEVGVETTESGHKVTLDKRPLRTPDGNVVSLPPERRKLALLVAAEWEGQQRTLKSHSLPLTGIVVRSIDSLRDPDIRQGVIDNVMRYLNTDSVCYHQDHPPSFVEMQKKSWFPLIQWVESEYGVQIKTTSGILSAKQDEKTVDALRKVVESFDNLELAAFEKAVMTSKSFIIGLALVKRRLSVEDAAEAARLEVLHQNIRWGEVEDSHDVDREDTKRQLGSVVCALL